MKKIEVLHIGKYYHPVKGGIENHMINLFSRIKDKVELKVIVSNTCCSKERSVINGVAITRLSRIIELFSTPINPSLFWEIKGFKGDIIHLHLPNPFANLAYLLANPKKKLVIKYHSDIIKQRFLLRLYSPFLKMLLRKADKIIATSPIYVESSPILKGFKDKCVVIPLGVDVSGFKLDDGRRKILENIKKMHNKRKIVLFVGRLVYYKGVEYLIKAHKDVDADLIIIGKGPLENGLKTMTKKLGIDKKVFFYGEVADLVPLYHACDVFVLPSIERSEAFGIVQLEAMACSKPVVSSNLNSGVVYVNMDRKTGIVVEPKDSKELSEAINYLMKNPSVAKKYGRFAKMRVEKEFTNEINANKVIRLYNRLLER
ncbi:hypothetical protein COV19_05535 [Candidatus Woesearchaeota archaeon CG10_big_fil_rev_8_21_14_0_10_44_13]|nr:MAG: hypothetical protein COV19_05535 [Candidatus Woesearchaeota archaeon CG10_big_fil_rev_8_21_14_0_10_44_13]